MKTAKILLTMVMNIIVLLVVANTAYAEEGWAEISNLTYTIDDNYNLHLSGVPTDQDLFLVFTQGNDSPNLPEGKYLKGYLGAHFYDENIATRGYSIEGYLEVNEDLYLWIYQSKQVGTEYINKCIVSKMKLERPAQRAIGDRLQLSCSDTYTFVDMNEPHTLSATGRRVTIQIGKITDKNILKSLQLKEENAYEKLLAYAKKSTPIFIGEAEMDGENHSLLNKVKCDGGAYFYAYITTNETDYSIYVPVEDVSLLQKYKKESTNKYVLYSYTHPLFSWYNLDIDTINTSNKGVTTEPLSVVKLYGHYEEEEEIEDDLQIEVNLPDKMTPCTDVEKKSFNFLIIAIIIVVGIIVVVGIVTVIIIIKSRKTGM